MRKLTFLFAVLVFASAANAALLLSVDGVVDPPDSQIDLLPGETAIIGIYGDGQTPPGTYFLGLSLDSPATLEEGTGIPKDPIILSWMNEGDIVPPVEFPFIVIEFPPWGPPLEGMLVDGIILHCEGLGDATLLFFDMDGVLIESQVIHQIPEPGTIALLVLGGLFLNRWR